LQWQSYLFVLNLAAVRIVLPFVVFTHLFFLRGYAQKEIRDIDLIFSRRHYSFSIVPFLDQKADITKNIDKYQIYSTIMHGFEAGFRRYSHFDKEHSLVIGLFFGAFARNFNFTIPGNEFNPPYDGNITSNTAASREFNFIGSIPVLFEKRWFTKNQNFWTAELGLTIRYTPSMDDGFGYTAGNNNDFLEMDLTTNPAKRPWLDYNAGVGYSWILKNNTIFKTALVLNLSFTPYIEGDYRFTVPNQPTVQGHYQAKGSYIGLSFGYIFTRTINKK